LVLGLVLSSNFISALDGGVNGILIKFSDYMKLEFIANSILNKEII